MDIVKRMKSICTKIYLNIHCYGINGRVRGLGWKKLQSLTFGLMLLISSFYCERSQARIFELLILSFWVRASPSAFMKALDFIFWLIASFWAFKQKLSTLNFWFKTLDFEFFLALRKTFNPKFHPSSKKTLIDEIFHYPWPESRKRNFLLFIYWNHSISSIILMNAEKILKSMWKAFSFHYGNWKAS